MRIKPFVNFTELDKLLENTNRTFSINDLRKCYASMMEIFRVYGNVVAIRKSTKQMRAYECDDKGNGVVTIYPREDEFEKMDIWKKIHEIQTLLHRLGGNQSDLHKALKEEKDTKKLRIKGRNLVKEIIDLKAEIENYSKPDKSQILPNLTLSDISSFIIKAKVAKFISIEERLIDEKFIQEKKWTRTQLELIAFGLIIWGMGIVKNYNERKKIKFKDFLSFLGNRYSKKIKDLGKPSKIKINFGESYENLKKHSPFWLYDSLPNSPKFPY